MPASSSSKTAKKNASDALKNGAATVQKVLQQASHAFASLSPEHARLVSYGFAGLTGLVVFFFGTALLFELVGIFFTALPLVIAAYAWTWFSRRSRRRSLNGLRVVVTGAGSGIGRLMSLKLAQEHSCRLVLLDINQANLTKVKDEVAALGGDVAAYICNVGDFGDVKDVASQIASDVGNVDVLINNAGIVSGKHVTELTEEHVRRTFDVNALAHVWTVKAFLPQMMARNSGTIVNIVSAAGITGVNGLLDYCGSKFAAFGMSESLRLDVAKREMNGIDVLAVCPYYIDTGMFTGVTTKVPALLPILKPEYVVDRVVDGIQHRDRLICLPGIVNVIFLARLLPVRVSDVIYNLLGISSTMDEFKGRGWSTTNPDQADAGKKIA